MATTYDYIIVGAGPAGCVLANRLSADPGVSVLIVDAGKTPSGLEYRMPILSPSLWGSPEATWMLKSQPEPALGGRPLPIPAGKVLGGGTAINGMTINRGLPTDYEAFKDLGLKDWGYRELLPYFLRSESSWRGESAYHATSGPMKFGPVRHRSPITHDALMAAQSLGFPLTEDFSGPQPVGFGVPDVNIVGGRRVGAYEAYLKPALSRDNLTVATETRVERVVVEHGRATGIDVRRHGRRLRMHASHEIVVVAGAFRTPHLLMHSGIGDPAELEPHGIGVTAANLEVGKNLVDQPAVGVEVACRPEIAFDREMRMDRLVVNALRWAVRGDGPFGNMPMVMTGIAAVDKASTEPDTRFMLGGTADSKAWWPWSAKRRGDVMIANAAVSYPHSRGHVRLASGNPDDAPHVNYNLLQDPRDVDALAKGYHALVQLLRQPSLRRHLGDIVRPTSPPETGAELAAFLKQAASTTQHPLATCRMGTDEASVVDPELRVRGVEGLRVADASVLPRQIGGNPTAVIAMLGEKAADLVLGIAPPPPSERGLEAIEATRARHRVPELPELPGDIGATDLAGATTSSDTWETQTGW